MQQIYQQDPKTLVFLVFSLIPILQPWLLRLGCSIHSSTKKTAGCFSCSSHFW